MSVGIKEKTVMGKKETTNAEKTTLMIVDK
jgi:hypothetical protein